MVISVDLPQILQNVRPCLINTAFKKKDYTASRASRLIFLPDMGYNCFWTSQTKKLSPLRPRTFAITVRLPSVLTKGGHLVPPRFKAMCMGRISFLYINVFLFAGLICLLNVEWFTYYFNIDTARRIIELRIMGDSAQEAGSLKRN